MQVDIDILAQTTEEDLLARNPIFERFFTAEAPRLAHASRDMAGRFMKGGRLLTFGLGSAATDAQHVAVEFVHPVIVGKRALPAIDLGSSFSALLPVVLHPEDIVMGFTFPGCDPVVTRALQSAQQQGAMTFALAGSSATYSFPLPDDDPFIAQELFEVLYHLLWETVHVYFEHREQGHDVGASSFLYPFLGKQEQTLDAVVEDVQQSMLQKMQEVNSIRAASAHAEASTISQIAGAIGERLGRGGKIITFGNGGSATDANDLAIDCVDPPTGLTPIPALSLSSEPATITAIANDIGAEAVFARQVIAHGNPEDIAIGISTSGSSANILAALREARERGLLTVAFAGYDGGKVASERLADYTVVARSDYIPRIQEAQASLYHVLRRRLNDVRDGSRNDA